MAFDPSTARPADQPTGFDPNSARPVDTSPPSPSTTAGGLAGAATRGLAPYAAGAAVGAGIGSLVGGVGAIPGAAIGAGAVSMTESAMGLYNPIAKVFGLPQATTPQEATDRLLDLVGEKRPSTALERGTESAVGGAAGALSGAGAAGAVAPSLTGTAGRVATELAKSPGAQAISGAAGGVGAQTAAEHGAGPVGQMVAGMVGAAAPAAAGRVAGGVVAPKVSADVQRLKDAGVELTPGQLAGQVPKRAEEALQSVPVTGSVVRGAARRSVDSFNRATANQALEPLGIKVPDVLVGHGINKFVSDKLGDEYDAVVPNLSLRATPALKTDLMTLSGDIGALALPRQQAGQFLKIIGMLNDRIRAQGGVLTKDVLQKQMEDLKTFSKNYGKDELAANRDLGIAVGWLKNTLDKALADQNPKYAGRLNDLDKGWAILARIESASNRGATMEGRYSPGQLLMTIRNQDPRIRHRGFAHGEALLQDWAETAQRVMGNQMGDSFTTERALWDVGLGAAAYAHPQALLGYGAASLPYTPWGQTAANWYAQPGAVRGGIRNAVRAPFSPVPILTAPGYPAIQPGQQ